MSLLVSNQSERMESKCPWCQGVLLPLTFNNLPLELYTSTLGSLFSKLCQERLFHEFYFAKCQICNLSQIVSSSKERQLGGLNKSIIYKEPEHHHHSVSSILISQLQHKKEAKDLLCK